MGGSGMAVGKGTEVADGLAVGAGLSGREVIRAGGVAVVHCRGGLGRAGTVAACCLVALGQAPADAMWISRTLVRVLTPSRQRTVGRAPACAWDSGCSSCRGRPRAHGAGLGA